MLRLCALLFAAAAFAFAPSSAHALDGVVASIKPVHSLVAGVMQGAGEPRLLVRGAGSPHTYSLRPSDAAALESAKLVFWVGPNMETFLDGAIDTLGSSATVVALGEARGLIKLPLREGGAYEAHEHERHEAARHDDEHGNEESTDAGHDHERGGFDTHLWLDPQNAAAMVRAMGEALAEADPENAELYAQNVGHLLRRLDALSNEIAAELEPLRDRPFVVFHDAYHYFEDRFGLQAAGSITVNPDIMPGAERVRAIQTKVRELGATCVFAEPQFEPKLIEVAIEGTDARSAVLDPLGAALDDGPDLYFELMRNMTSSLKACLSGTN